MVKLIGYLIASTLIFLVPVIPKAVAQIIPDQTLEQESSVVKPINDLDDRIDGGAIRGGNLFHSFLEFNVGEARGVYFANPSGIDNILSWVTGNNPSNIFGHLGVLGDANLFLVNPHGFLFGPNASVDVTGSFHVSTAAEIPLDNQGLFSAVELMQSQLLSMSPSATFFNQVINHSGSVINRGSLSVGEGQTLILSGREVLHSGSISAPDGSVILRGNQLRFRGSVNAETLVLETENHLIGAGSNLEDPFKEGITIYESHLEDLAGETNVSLLAINDIQFEDLGDNVLTFNYGGGSIELVSDLDFDGSGSIVMVDPELDILMTNGRDISISGASLFLGNIATYADIISPARSGNVNLKAFNSVIEVGSINTSSTIGNGGEFIFITAGDIFSGDIFTNVRSSVLTWEGGSIILQAEIGNISTGDLNSFSSSGDGGNIILRTESGHISTGNLNSFSSSGDGGNIILRTESGDISTGRLNSSSFSYFSSVPSFLSFSSSGDGGSIILQTELGNISTGGLNSSSYPVFSGASRFSLSLLSPLSRFPFSDFSSGNAGNIILTTDSGNIYIESNISLYSFASSLRIDQEAHAGDILIAAKHGSIRGNDTILNAISIVAEDHEGQGIMSSSGGNVTLIANSISDLEIATLSNNGPAGSVNIQGTSKNFSINDLNITSSAQVTIPNPLLLPGEITLNLNNVGQAGSTSITSSGSLTLDNVQLIGDSHALNDAGGLILQSPGPITLTNTILNSNANDLGSAGVITITTDDALTLGENNLIFARTLSQGQGGNINISANQLILTPNTAIIASSEGSGNAGNINIDAHQSVLLDQSSQLIVETSNAGRAGSINIATDMLTIGPNAQLSATATETATSPETGNISIKANTINIAGKLGIFAETAGITPAGTLTLQPNGSAPNLDIFFTDAGFLSASTTGIGTGGNINISAPESISIAGTGFISVSSSGSGDAGALFS